MTWIRLDPNELGTTGAHLRDISAALIDSAARVRSACCQPGLGRHAGPLMAEGDSLANQTISITDGYLRLGIDILQRAIAAVRDGQLVSSVGGVGSVSAAVIGGTFVGGGSTMTIGGNSWSDGITVGGGGTMTIGGNSWSDGITVGGGGTMTIGGNSWSSGISVGGASTMTIGGTAFVGGGSGTASGVMALAQAAQNSQERQRALLARLQASGGGGNGSAGLGNQALVDMLNKQALKGIENSQIRTAANSPIAGYPEAQAADATDFGGRVRALDDARYYEQKRLGQR